MKDDKGEGEDISSDFCVSTLGTQKSERESGIIVMPCREDRASGSLATKGGAEMLLERLSVLVGTQAQCLRPIKILRGRLPMSRPEAEAILASAKEIEICLPGGETRRVFSPVELAGEGWMGLALQEPALDPWPALE